MPHQTPQQCGRDPLHLKQRIFTALNYTSDNMCQNYCYFRHFKYLQCIQVTYYCCLLFFSLTLSDTCLFMCCGNNTSKKIWFYHFNLSSHENLLCLSPSMEGKRKPVYLEHMQLHKGITDTAGSPELTIPSSMSSHLFLGVSVIWDRRACDCDFFNCWLYRWKWFQQFKKGFSN